jgi:hypothetical protein
VREERQVDGEVEQRRRLGVAPEHVDDVAEGLEGEERDRHREDDLERHPPRVDADRAEGAAHRLDEEVGVLVVGEHAEVDHHGGAQDRLAAALVGLAVDRHREALVGQDREAEQQAVDPLEGAVEDEAGGEQEPAPGLRLRAQEPADDEHAGEEHGELEGGEQHSPCSRGPSGGHPWWHPAGLRPRTRKT